MALGNYLSSLNLDPATQQKILASYGPAPASEGPENYGAPSPQEMQAYGASPEEVAVAQRANATPYAAGNPTNPIVADPKWDPVAERKRTAEEAAKKERAAATPQGPAGDDGFPTYRDLSKPTAEPPTAVASPMRLFPAHWQPGSRSESRTMGMDPGELQSGEYHRDAAAGQHLMGAEKHLEAAQMQAEADAQYAAAHQEASRIEAAKLAQLEQQRQAYVTREQEKLETLSQAAQQQVDPEIAKGNSGAQLMAAIGIAMGQFGASINGGQNAALQIVNSNIDRRIKAQETNISNAAQAHRLETGLYKDNLAEFGDRERAILASKVQMLDQAKALADQQYAAAKGTANEGQYHEFVGALSEERAKAADRFAQLTHTQISTQGNEHFVPAQMVGGASAGAKGKEKLYVPSLGGYARDEEGARKLNAHGALRTQINEDLHEIHSLLKESKGLSSATDYGRMQEVRQRIAALKNGVLQKTTVLADQGAMSNGDKDVAEVRSALGSIDPQLKTDAQIERMQKGIASVAKSHLRDARLEGEAYGIQLGKEEYQAGANGPEAVARLAGSNKIVSKKTESVDDLIEPPKGKSDR